MKKKKKLTELLSNLYPAHKPISQTNIEQRVFY